MRIIKVVFVLASVCLISLWSRANGHDSPDPPRSDPPGHREPIPGPSGPQGVMGLQGEDGRNGTDADSDANHAYVGAQVLWHEWDNHVGIGSGYRFDTLHHGHVFDMAILQARFGQSPEDRQISALKRELDTYKTVLYRIADQIPKPKEEPVRARIRGSK